MHASSPTERAGRPAPGRRAWLGLAAALSALALAGCVQAPAIGTLPVPAEVRAALAPTGVLRVAVYPGSPTSMLPAGDGQPMRGLAVEAGRALAQRLSVPVELVVMPRVAEVLAALKAGQADFTVTNATPERAAELDFSAPLVALELGVLVRGGSALDSIEALDAPGVRVGVSQGSTSQRVLAERWRRVQLVPMPSLQAAAAAMNGGQLDAFATNKGILFEMAGRVPGSRVLDGRWGLERLAVAVPQGRGVAAEELRRFVQAIVADGTVARAAERAGLRGLAPPDAR